MEEKKEHIMKEHEKHESKCKCHSCVCEILKDLVEYQKENLQGEICSLQRHRESPDIIPFILQTPYGEPFFTIGNIGKDCFVTIFFKVVKVDCEKNCAILKLLKPNRTIVDPETGCVELDKVCEVDYLIETNECVFVGLSCYNAIKLVDPKLVKKI